MQSTTGPLDFWGGLGGRAKTFVLAPLVDLSPGPSPWERGDGSTRLCSCSLGFSQVRLQFLQRSEATLQQSAPLPLLKLNSLELNEYLPRFRFPIPDHEEYIVCALNALNRNSKARLEQPS
jgi:hypothetical protein